MVFGKVQQFRVEGSHRPKNAQPVAEENGLAVDPAFVKAGTQPGLQIWRIEVYPRAFWLKESSKVHPDPCTGSQSPVWEGCTYKLCANYRGCAGCYACDLFFFWGTPCIWPFLGVALTPPPHANVRPHPNDPQYQYPKGESKRTKVLKICNKSFCAL